MARGSKTRHKCCLWKKCLYKRTQWCLSSGSASLSFRRISSSLSPVLCLERVNKKDWISSTLVITHKHSSKARSHRKDQWLPGRRLPSKHNFGASDIKRLKSNDRMELEEPHLLCLWGLHHCKSRKPSEHTEQPAARVRVNCPSWNPTLGTTIQSKIKPLT